MKTPSCILLPAILLACASESCAQITRSFTTPIEIREVAATQPDVLQSLLVKPGSILQTGDVIAEVDNSVLRNQLLIAELRANSDAAVRSAEINYDSIQKRLEKLNTMLDKGHANPSEVEQAQVESDTSLAELQLAREKKKEFAFEVKRIQAEIERNIVRSPICGVVTEVHCKPGEFISSQERKLVTVVDIDQLRVRFYLAANTIEELTSGKKVNLLIGERRESVAGIVEFVSPVVDADSGTSQVDVIIDNQHHSFRAGVVCFWPTANSDFVNDDYLDLNSNVADLTGIGANQ